MEIALCHENINGHLSDFVDCSLYSEVTHTRAVEVCELQGLAAWFD